MTVCRFWEAPFFLILHHAWRLTWRYWVTFESILSRDYQSDSLWVFLGGVSVSQVRHPIKIFLIPYFAQYGPGRLENFTKFAVVASWSIDFVDVSFSIGKCVSVLIWTQMPLCNVQTPTRYSKLNSLGKSSLWCDESRKTFLAVQDRSIGDLVSQWVNPLLNWVS